MSKLLVLSSQSGDWEGLFVDGVLRDEGHTLGEGDSKRYWIGIALEYNIDPEELITKEVVDADEEYLYAYGRFPKELSQLKGKYD